MARTQGIDHFTLVLRKEITIIEGKEQGEEDWEHEQQVGMFESGKKKMEVIGSLEK